MRRVGVAVVLVMALAWASPAEAKPHHKRCTAVAAAGGGFAPSLPAIVCR